MENGITNDQMRTCSEQCYTENYKEKPVDVIRFLKDSDYLGRVTGNMRAIYPGWVEAIVEVFEDDFKYLVVLTGSIGVGKTMFVCGLCMPYILYRISMLRDPWGFFDKNAAGKMEVCFFNLTKTLSGSRGFAYLQNSLQNSPWFRDHAGSITHGGRNPIMDLPQFQWLLASPYAKGFGTLGGNIVAAAMDEVDSPNESQGLKKRILGAYDNSVRRFESRFVRNGASLGRMFLVASKQDEMSFLEVFIEEMRHSDRVLVFDKAQWEIFPKDRYCGKRFFVMVGDAYRQPKIIEESEKLQCVKEGMRVIDVPVEHKFEFERDIVGSLRDLAGISVKGLRRHKLIPAEKFIRECMDADKTDPVSVDTIEIGLNDDIELIHCIDLTKIRVDMGVARSVHIDIAFVGDALGFACSCVGGWRDVPVEQGDGTFRVQRLPIAETDFVLRIKAREGDRIPIAKVLKLLIDLKARGLNLRKVTIDLQLAAESSLQTLNKVGIEASYLSVDKDVKPYIEFRNLVYDQRWVCHPQKWVYFELKHLEIDREKNKIDHPDKVKEVEFLDDGSMHDIVVEGSKDVIDAVVGSVYTTIANAKPPIVIEEVKSALQAGLIKKAPPDGIISGDWFMKKKEGEPGVLAVNGEPLAGNAAKMADALRKLNKGKGGPGKGIFR